MATVARRVLLVDDAAAFRTLVSTALRLRGGFDVVGEASSGRGAIDAATELQPDVVVLDLGLPDLAGADVIAAIRAHAPDARIVVFTGRDVDADAVRSVEGFVRKGEDVQLLLDVLGDVAGARQGASATLDLDADLTSAGRARAFVEERCDAWGVGGVLDDALLVVSELVTNAIVHAGSDAGLRLTLGVETLRIEVADAGGDAPDPVLADDDDEHGRGLLLVAVLSAAWGTESTPEGGKVVWAELPLAQSVSVSA
jgi:CheY-like chemotaxis protein